MGQYVLSCCSTVDLTPERMQERDFRYVCFKYTVDGTEYRDDMGVSMSSEELFRRMSGGAETKTSQVSVEEYQEHFEGLLKQGLDVLHVTLSTGLTGTYNSACITRDMLVEKYPERKLYVVDSLGASSGYGLIMETLADMRDGGATIDELHGWVVENRLRMHHWFFSTDLSFYVRGGRISKAAGAIGTAYSGKCFICHSLCMEDAQTVAERVESRFPQLNGKVEISPIGATIGSHTGPGTMALFFWGDKRIN